MIAAGVALRSLEGAQAVAAALRVVSWGLRHYSQALACDGRRIEQLAQGVARRACDKIERESRTGREVNEFERVEAVNVARRLLLAVYTVQGVAPRFIRHRVGGRKWDSSQAWADGVGRSCWLLWRRAMRGAGKAIKAALWGAGGERMRFESLDVLRLLGGGSAEVGSDTASAIRSGWSVPVELGGAFVPRKLTAADVRALSADYADDRLAVCVYWVNRGGKGFLSTLQSRLRLLGAVHAARVGRGVGAFAPIGYLLPVRAGAAVTERRNGVKVRSAYGLAEHRLGMALRELRAEITAGAMVAQREAASGKLANGLAFLACVLRGRVHRDLFGAGGAVDRLQARLGGVEVQREREQAPAVPVPVVPVPVPVPVPLVPVVPVSMRARHWELFGVYPSVPVVRRVKRAAWVCTPLAARLIAQAGKRRRVVSSVERCKRALAKLPVHAWAGPLVEAAEKSALPVETSGSWERGVRYALNLPLGVPVPSRQHN